MGERGFAQVWHGSSTWLIYFLRGHFAYLVLLVSSFLSYPSGRLLIVCSVFHTDDSAVEVGTSYR